MSSLQRATFRDTFQAIDEFLCEGRPNCLIDKDLRLIEKTGCQWVLLCLLSPFYRLFGTDPYSHVRIHHVADQVLQLCEENKEDLNDWLITNIKERILESLNVKTKEKYKEYFDETARKLDVILATSRKSLNNYKALDELDTVDPDHLKCVNAALSETFSYLEKDPKEFHLRFEKLGRKSDAARFLILEQKSYRSFWQEDFFYREVKRFSIPLSLNFYEMGFSIIDIILLAKRVIGEGGRIKVRKNFSLLGGRDFETKKILPYLIDYQVLSKQGTIDSDHLKRINSALSEALPYLSAAPKEYCLEFEKLSGKLLTLKYLILKRNVGNLYFGEVKRFSMPLSLHIEMRDSFLYDIILLAKGVIGQGGQTKVRECFGLLTGRAFARKKILSVDREALQPLLERNLFNSDIRGLVPIPAWHQIDLSWREVNPYKWSTADGKELVLRNDIGLQLFELKSEGPLEGAFENYKDLWSQTSIKKTLIEDLLHGIYTLHQQEHPGFKMNFVEEKPQDFLSYSLPIPPFRLAHGDLNPRNILIDVVEGKLRARITDFGALNPAVPSYTQAFSSPEKIARYFRKADPISFHQRYGQASDMWALGLICVLILNGKLPEERLVPCDTPLPSVYLTWFREWVLSLESGLDGLNWTLSVENQTFRQTSQEIINQDLTDFASQSDPELEPIWYLVGRMLQKNPEERITAEVALAEFRKYS